jgi:hypothetical protein
LVFLVFCVFTFPPHILNGHLLVATFLLLKLLLLLFSLTSLFPFFSFLPFFSSIFLLRFLLIPKLAAVVVGFLILVDSVGRAMSFRFQHAAELLCASQYLAQFDDTVKFKLVHESCRTTLQMSTVNVPPFSYTTIDLIDEPARQEKVFAIEPATTSWAVNTMFFVNVLNCFDPQSPLIMEIAADLSYVFLYQKKADNASVQVAQVGALHDLGPKLLVDHDVRELYTIADIRSFSDVIRSICASDDDRCDIFLRRTSSRECELTMTTTNVTSSLRLLLDEQKTAAKHLEGSARCDDLQEFARLCLRTTKLASSASLMMGFGSDGIALFRLDWTTESGPRTANLFFCAV